MLASTRREPTWRTMPPIRSGSTVRVASTLRPERCSIWPTIARASSSESSKAVVSSTVSSPSSAAASRSNSSATSATSPARPFSTSRRRKLRTSGSRSPGDRLDGGRLRALVELRVAEDLAELGHGVDRLDEVAEVAGGRRRGGRPPARRRRARARRCGGRPTSARLVPAPAPRSRARRSRPRSACGGRRGRAPCRSPSRWRSSVSSATSARICSSDALGLRVDLLLRLLEAPLAVGLGLLADALPLGVGHLAGLGQDLLGVGLAPCR